MSQLTESAVETLWSLFRWTANEKPDKKELALPMELILQIINKRLADCLQFDPDSYVQEVMNIAQTCSTMFNEVHRIVHRHERHAHERWHYSMEHEELHSYLCFLEHELYGAFQACEGTFEEDDAYTMKCRNNNVHIGFWEERLDITGTALTALHRACNAKHGE